MTIKKENKKKAKIIFQGEKNYIKKNIYIFYLYTHIFLIE